MRAEGQTFWLLDGRVGWQEAQRQNASQGVVSGIRLDSQPDGPLSLTSRDGSLGRLTLPRGMAFNSTLRLYLLTGNDLRIKRFDPTTRAFLALPAVGGVGSEARQFDAPANIAIAGRFLYVADAGNRRVQAFALDSLALQHLWGPRDAFGVPTGAADPNAWKPADVCARNGDAYLLDSRYGRVYRHRPGSDALTCIVDQPEAADRWSRITVDRAGRICLLDAAVPRLERYGPEGAYLDSTPSAGDVRDQFDPPLLTLYQRTARDPGRFCLPESLTRDCDRQPPLTSPPAERPLELCDGGGLVFDPNGDPAAVDPTEAYGPRIYQQEGSWTSAALDSRTYRCQWHRIVLNLGALPAGSQIEALTCVSDRNDPAPPKFAAVPTGQGAETVVVPSEDVWTALRQEPHLTLTGQMQPPEGAQTGGDFEFLVQSREGQYLWLRLLLSGDGYDTPTVESIRVEYPRESYLQYLPAIYSADDEMAWFLQRFLSLFQTEWDGVEHTIGEIARYFDPKTVPDGPFLEYLARWLALPLEGDWSEAQKRNLLVAAPGFLAQRGTLAGLRAYLQVYLQNITGLDSAAQGGYPQIVEGFRERDRLLLSAGDTARLDHGAPLWSLNVVGRLQLGVFAQAGDVQLVSTGDPRYDLFRTYAHRFRVFLPSAWVATRDDETRIRRALDAEKPAHTKYDLCLIEPRFRIGIQSTIGLDTILGDYPVARLSCAQEIDAAPLGRPPRHRLGYDTILGGKPTGDPVAPVTPGMCVGDNMILT